MPGVRPRPQQRPLAVASGFHRRVLRSRAPRSVDTGSGTGIPAPGTGALRSIAARQEPRPTGAADWRARVFDSRRQSPGV